MDLSLWPVGGQGETSQLSSGKRTADSFANVLEIGKNMILANDINHLCRYVDQLPPTRMDIVVDNAGFELFCDLCLADFLISSEIASQVHLQLKAHPTFVSDAMSKDVSHTIHFLQTTRTQDGQESPTSALGNRWADYVATGRWVLTEHFFWVQPQAMWEMPNALKMELSNSALVFVKGDANYRRLLGERHWDFDTPFNDVLCYFPAPICALRTLKAEIGCGMSKEATMRASQQDVNWLVAGKYGVIQFCDTRSL